jgi:transposase
VFVQTTKSKRGRNTYFTYLVRQSFRTPNGPRSRTIANITGLPPELRDTIAAALRGQGSVPLDQLQLHAALDYGGLAVLHDAWDRFGLDRLFEGIVSARQRGLLKAMVLARLIFPCAKLALAQRARGSLLAQACGLAPTESFNEDDLYAAMDQLNGRWVRMEKQLFAEAFPQGVRLVLYDLSSVFFEGKGPRPISQFGHSRDHRSDRPQVLLAVLTNTEGIPLHMEVLRGNRTDNKTLQSLLKTVRRRFGIVAVTFVFDGGMSSQFNLEAMTEQKLHYVTRLSSSSLQAVLAELLEERQLELGDRKQILEVTHAGKRYVIAGGEWRQERDRQRRAARLLKGETELKRIAAVTRKKPHAQKLMSQVGRALQRLKAHKYFTYEVDASGQLQWARKKEVIQSEEQVDGWYLLQTNLTVEQGSGPQTVAHYKGLLTVEEAFCELKSYLEVRPVFHWKPQRVRNHVRLCFLAYWISARLGQEWRVKKEKGEVPRLLRELQTIRIGFLKMGKQELKPLMTQVPEDLNKLLAELDLLKLFATPSHWAVL